MAERAITLQANKNRSQFLDNLQPVLSFDELIRDKLECGKFPLTKTGWIKIIAVIVSLAGLALFFVQGKCKGSPSWYQYLFPISVGLSILTQMVFYLAFSFGVTVKYPGKWVKADIFLNLITALVSIIASVMTTTECNGSGTLHGVPGPIGIAGGILMVIGCAAIFLMYRYVDEEDEVPPQSPIPRNIDIRKSMHA